jgi:hypothetical protein
MTRQQALLNIRALGRGAALQGSEGGQSAPLPGEAVRPSELAQNVIFGPTHGSGTDNFDYTSSTIKSTSSQVGRPVEGATAPSADEAKGGSPALASGDSPAQVDRPPAGASAPDVHVPLRGRPRNQEPSTRMRVRISSKVADQLSSLRPRQRESAVALLLSANSDGINLSELVASRSEVRKLGVLLNQSLSVYHHESRFHTKAEADVWFSQIKDAVRIIKRLESK